MWVICLIYTLFIRSKHTYEFIYDCPSCSKGFASTKALYYHKTRHENSNLFYCVDCQHFYKTVDYSKHMERHSKMHFSCEVCEKSFGNVYALEAHNKVHSKQFKYPCKKCDKTQFFKSLRLPFPIILCFDKIFLNSVFWWQNSK